MAEPAPFSLDDFLQQRWEPLAARVGERRAALLQTIDEKTVQRGFAPGVQAARFANLCMALGPGFETRPENEWALAILLDERLSPWVKLHQLVHKADATLRRRGGDGIALAQRLRDNDLRVLDGFDPPPQAPIPRALVRPPSRLQRVACDLEAAELRLLDTGFRQEYRQQGGLWQRVPVDAPTPLRIDAQHPAPERISLLTRVDGDAAPVRLQVRTVYHARCGLGLHPAVEWVGARGRERWQDEAARAPAWPISVPPESGPVRLLLEAGHDISLLTLHSCGLRDEGVPMGSPEVQLWAYAARQSLMTMAREASLGFVLPADGSSPPAVKPTRIDLERDGSGGPHESWQTGFDIGLRQALDQGLQRLLQAWQPHVQEASLRAELSLFDGKAGITWGLREGARGLASPPIERVVADIDWLAAANLHLQGQVEFAGARARLHLRIEGSTRLQAQIERLQAEVPVAVAMQGAQISWRWPVQLDFDPVADEGGLVFAEAGPVTGALTGTLGLRPCPTVGGAWEWFATLAIDPVATRVVVHDPVLGRSECHMALLGSVQLLDWSQV